MKGPRLTAKRRQVKRDILAGEADGLDFVDRMLLDRVLGVPWVFARMRTRSV